MIAAAHQTFGRRPLHAKAIFQCEQAIEHRHDAAQVDFLLPLPGNAITVEVLRHDVVDAKFLHDRHEFVDPDIPPRPTIAGLTGPSVLTVDELSLESLAVAPVEVVDLEDPPSLELPALDMSRPGEFR